MYKTIDIPSSFNAGTPQLVNFLHETKQNRDYRYLYEHQIDAALHVRDYLERNPPDKYAIIVLPTGCGKTGVAVVASYAVNVRKVLVITPSVKISQQIHEAFVGIEGEKDPFMIERGIMEDKELIPSCGWVQKPSDVKKNLQNELLIVNAHKLTDEILFHIPKEKYDLVIVDEAHHYPAKTWKEPVDHFTESKHIFLTATPFNKGKRILPEDNICYEMSKDEAVDKGIIRPLNFIEVRSIHDEDNIYEDMYEKLTKIPKITPPQDKKCEKIYEKMFTNVNNFFRLKKEDKLGQITEELLAFKSISTTISQVLQTHDSQDPTVKHQAMVLVHTTQEADNFSLMYNCVEEKINCAPYYTESKYGRSSFEHFLTGAIRVLVVAGSFLEGFDHKPISVVAIARNVQSRVLFTQFVGRAVRKAHPYETIQAMLISHLKYNQGPNYDQFNQIADIEQADNEDD